MTFREQCALAAMRAHMHAQLSGTADHMTPRAVAHSAWSVAAAMESERKRRDQAEPMPPTAVFQRGQRVEYIGPVSSVINSMANVGTVDAVHGDRYGIRWDGGGYSTEGAADIRATAEPQLTAAQVMELGRRVGKEEMDAACEKARREGRDAGLRNVRSAVMAEAAAFMRDEPAGPMVSRIIDRIDKLIGMAPPAPDALASENAKLRAVAEAAARLQRLRDSNRPDGIGEASLQLDGALGNWLPGWRTK